MHTCITERNKDGERQSEVERERWIDRGERDWCEESAVTRTGWEKKLKEDRKGD